MKMIMRHGLLLILVAVIALVYFFTYLVTFLGDLYWFGATEYQSVFLTILLSDLGLKIAAFVFLFGVFFANLILTLKFINFKRVFAVHDNEQVIPMKKYFTQKFFNKKSIIYLYAILSVLFALVFSGLTNNQWLVVQSYLNANSFNLFDPIFAKDISFYVFELPFYRLLYYFGVSAVIGSGILVGLFYFLFTPREYFHMKSVNFKQPQIHLSVIVAFFFVFQGINYRLNTFELMHSQRGLLFGGGYTDIVVQLPVYNILAVLSLLLAVLIIVSIFMRIYKLIVLSIAVFILSSILLGSVVPASVQKFFVEPNEFVREAPYIEHSISFTRSAFNLDLIDVKPFALDRELTLDDIEKNSHTIDNVRLWDYRPLRQTFEQLQTLRLYYQFHDVDIDRYWIDGEYRQVMLAARELDIRQLQPQAQTWINQKLRYTHGYGLVMAAVNETTSEGLPYFLIKDFPPQPVSPDLTVTQPGIYFGELTTNSVIVNTNTKEFHYPSGNDNVEVSYEGSGGVVLDSLWKRLFFAIHEKDFRILISGEITETSKLLYHRDIRSITEKIAPFLIFDNDPYMMIDSTGKLYWIRDGYTVSSMYPYAQRYRNSFNYIRNSVKVVIDAYNGEAKFFICDDTDPIIATYAEIFPELFTHMDEMPTNLRKHIRYPAYYFNLQAQVLTLFHMQNPQVFYNREDAWTIPQEIFQGESQLMEPYYTIMQLPGGSEPEYVLMLPFTPLNRGNMVAWMVARNDGDHYGKVELYQFPKESHVFGPMQIEARIDQDSEISQQLTLWDQRGSQVLRGNLLVIPVENSLLYIEPVFLQAEQSKIPELRRVIVAYGDQIVMKETLAESLAELFGERPEATDEPDADSGQLPDRIEWIEGSMAELIQKANQIYADAILRQQAGDWAGYGQLLNELENVLNTLTEIVEDGYDGEEIE